MGIRLTVLVAAALLVSPAIASAGQIEDAQKVALLYWADRGHSECEGVQVEVRWFSEYAPGRSLASAATGGCPYTQECESGQRTCSAGPFAVMNLSEQILPRPWRLNCRSLVHEYGHLVGLEHDSRWPVMNRMAVPNECRNPTRLQARVRHDERRARGLSRRDHPHRARRFERRARQVSRQAERAAEFRVRAGL